MRPLGQLLDLTQDLRFIQRKQPASFVDPRKRTMVAWVLIRPGMATKPFPGMSRAAEAGSNRSVG